MTEPLRAVFDTNVYISASLSHNPTSPTRELIERWKNNEFTLLVCDALFDEIIEVLLERNISQRNISELTELLAAMADWVDVPIESVQRIIKDDSDDDIIVACALLGDADYIVTYDPHFDLLGGEYRGIKITRALPFLWAVRASLG